MKEKISLIQMDVALGQVDAEEIFAKLREKHIFVRHFNSERIKNYLRISIGTREEMEKFIDELKCIL